MSEIERVTSVEELDALFEASREHPVWLFKHSLTCPVSSRAWGEFQEFVAERGEGGEASRYAVIEVQRARAASNAAAERTGVRHESPQVLLLLDGRAGMDASHFEIRREMLDEVAEG